MLNKSGTTQWTIGKLMIIVLLFIVLVLIVYSVLMRGLNPLIEKDEEMFDSNFSNNSYINFNNNSTVADFPELYTIQGFGVNIHSQSYTYEDLDMMEEAGFKIIRTDMLWHEIEKEKGVYDFSTFDQLLSELDKRNIRPYLILDYGNPLYGCTTSVTTTQCMEGYKNFIKMAVARYKQYNPIWEIWNEPDVIHFWYPQPAYQEYTNLVKEAVFVIKSVDPRAVVIGPAVGNLNYPYPFLEECFKRGLLDYVDAVSVHPYREPPLESVIDDYANLRNLIKQYNPDNPDIPIIAGEWGESSSQSLRNEENQAKYLLREFLINLYQGIPVTIWYKWKDDGTSDKKKDNWGMITRENFTAKQALNSFTEMTKILQDTDFIERINYYDSEVFLLLFKNNFTSKYIFVGWSSGEEKKINFSDGNMVTLTDCPEFMEIDEIPNFVNLN